MVSMSLIIIQFADEINWWYLPTKFTNDKFAVDICWWYKLIVRVPPGPENEAGRPNSYGQPQVIDEHEDRYDDDYDDYDDNDD